MSTTVAAPTPIFTARGVTKRYHMGEVTVDALRGVDFDLFPGEFVVLLGPSGSGKSTLLNILGALTTYRREHVGVVFQFYNLIPSLTAREKLPLVTEISALGVEEQRVNVILDMVDGGGEDAVLGDAYRVEVRIVMAEAADVLKVPTAALFRHDAAWAVYAVRDGRARILPVEIGRQTPREAEVLQGLTQGDRVVLHPADALSEGARVAARDRY